MSNLGNLINLELDQNKIAIIDEERRVTYRQLHNMSNYAAFDLQSKGFKPGDRIAIKGFNSISYIAAYLGILKLGAVAVLINAKLPQSQVDFIVKDSEAKFLWDDPKIPSDVFIDFKSFEAEDDSPAIIMYTSGSTSNPKGVILPHKHLWIIKQKSNFPSAIHRRTIVAAPLYHMNGLSNSESTLCGHGTLILLKKFDPVQFLKRISYHRVNSVTSVPTMLAMMLQEKELISKLDLKCITHISMASAPVSKNLLETLKSTFPKVIINNAYGVTEVSPGMFGRHPTMPTPLMSVGYPIPGIEYRLVDGILQVKSPSMLLNYNNLKSNNITEDGFFITNDLFKVDENGFYFFLGRADDMFVSGGNNIYPRQIETVLEDHPLVKSAAVIGLEDELKGMKPYAFVISTAKEDDLKKFVLEKLPPSHCPRNIWSIISMPLTSVNKIDKANLKEQARKLRNVVQETR